MRLLSGRPTAFHNFDLYCNMFVCCVLCCECFAVFSQYNSVHLLVLSVRVSELGTLANRSHGIRATRHRTDDRPSHQGGHGSRESDLVADLQRWWWQVPFVCFANLDNVLGWTLVFPSRPPLGTVCPSPSLSSGSSSIASIVPPDESNL